MVRLKYLELDPVSKKIISFKESGLLTFYPGFENRKNCSIWQSIFWVMEQQCSDQEQIDCYAGEINELEIEFIEMLIEHCISGALELVDSKGIALSLDERVNLSAGNDISCYLRVEDASYYLAGLNEYRFQIVEKSKAAYLIYALLMSQVQKANSNEQPILAIKPGFLSDQSESSLYSCSIGKGSLKNWKKLLLTDGSAVLDSVITAKTRTIRSDTLENHQKVIGLMLYLFSKVLPSSCKLIFEDSGKLKVAPFERFLSKNVLKEDSVFPEERTLKDILFKSLDAFKGNVRPIPTVEIPLHSTWKKLNTPLSIAEKSTECSPPKRPKPS